MLVAHKDKLIKPETAPFGGHSLRRNWSNDNSSHRHTVTPNEQQARGRHFHTEIDSQQQDSDGAATSPTTHGLATAKNNNSFGRLYLCSYNGIFSCHCL
ncbi:hypothetical protein SEMRO_135_G063650.1 [Seminavis robusta]|uniref:Uncharacterized protein n=1 Tax=Seminavis robusta TaxID=568900 RepID=A0A9N8DKM8_9STRA|nr:hypothetical protein SEMRO_135_G063650.1 [Seminavis robusta]|eukprot:Sro135_g063650.1 n/a (99) ;mRNA; f:14687-14983